MTKGDHKIIEFKMAFCMVNPGMVGDTVTMYLQGGKIALHNCNKPMAYSNLVVAALTISSEGKLRTTWGSLKAGYNR